MRASVQPCGCIFRDQCELGRFPAIASHGFCFVSLEYLMELHFREALLSIHETQVLLSGSRVKLHFGTKVRETIQI